MEKRPVGAPMDPKLHAQVRKFLRLKPGQSIFVEGVERKDVEFMRRPVMRAGAGIRIVTMQCDPTHNKPGVRMFRISGEIDKDL